MRKFLAMFGCRRKLLLSAAGFTALAIPLALVVVHATPSRARSQDQRTATATTVFEYEVASIKPSKADVGAGIMVGMTDTFDGLTSTNVPLMFLVQSAYGVNAYQISGAPSWLASDRYDVAAKMDGSVAAALQKLAPEERTFARRKMLQALLASRMKLVVHRGTKELPVFSLVIAKNGPKFKESKPGDSSANEDNSRSGKGISMSGTSEGLLITARAVPIENLVRTLSAPLSCPVLDKTGLAGLYDFTLEWTPDDSQPGPNAPNLFIAIQEQLGLKLESGKGPVEVIVIDHVERPSGN